MGASYEFIATTEKWSERLGYHGPVERIFGEAVYEGSEHITALEVHCFVGEGGRWKKDSAFGEFATVFTEPRMALQLLALGPKKILFKTIIRAVASSCEVISGTDIPGGNSLEKLVDYSVSEAERLAAKYDMNVKVFYHHETNEQKVFARKYLEQ